MRRAPGPFGPKDLPPNGRVSRPRTGLGADNARRSPAEQLACAVRVEAKVLQSPAAGTVLVVRVVTRASAPCWMAYLGYAAAALIATGVVVPLGLDIARLTNFAGDVGWCAWLVAMAIVLWRDKPHADGTAAPTATTRHRNSVRS
jgi:hypothetical protein